MFKAVFLRNRNRYVVHPVNPTYSPQIYLFDSVPITIDGKRSSEGIEFAAPPKEIVRVSTTQITDHYQDASGSVMSVDEYNAHRLALLAKRVAHERECDEPYHTWVSLDDEFAFRKFEQRWNRITREIVTLSDALPLEVIETVSETGNSFVRSLYSAEGSFSDQAIYLRPSAVVAIFSSVCEDSGLRWVDGSGFKEGACKSDEYSNSSHSAIRFAKVCGDYAFDDSFDIKHNLRGSLSEMLAAYDKDVKSITQKIHAKIALRRGAKLSEATTLHLSSELSQLVASLGRVQSKQATQSDLFHARKKAKALKELLETALANSVAA